MSTLRPSRARRAARASSAFVRRLALVCGAALLAACGGSDAVTGPGGGGTPRSDLPEGLVGRWRYGVVSSTNFWNDHTGVYAGNAYGISDYYDFAANGTYKRLTYIYTNSYGCQTQVWTEMQGTLTADDERFTLYPTQGRYKVADNCAASRNYTRPMTAAELTERQGDVWVWERGQDAYGQEVLAADKPEGNDPALYEREP